MTAPAPRVVSRISLMRQSRQSRQSRRAQPHALVKLATASAAIVVGAALGGACLDPTQITLDVTTNVPCAQSNGVGFTGGLPGSVERIAPSTVTMSCSGSTIGTLVSTPKGDKDSAAAFVIVQGIDRPASECAAAGFKGCIVARRILRYLAHTPLHLPVAMRLVCKDVACDEFQTCAKSGKCVSAEIPDPESCPNGVCVPPGDEDGPDAPTDGGPGDASGDTSSDVDGSKTDGAPTDSGTDAPPPPPPGTLYCPPTGGCATGTKCCWKRQSAISQGVCIPDAQPCPGAAADVPMQCNRKSDCSGAQYCCASDLVPFPPPPPEQTFADTHCSDVGLPCKWICLENADCPPSVNVVPMRCDRNTPYFTPAGIMGVCVSGVIAENDAAKPIE